MGKYKKQPKKKIIQYFKEAKYVVGGILLVLAFIAGIFSFDNRYFKAAEAQQQKQEATKSFDQVYKNLQVQQEQIESWKKKHDLQDELKELINEEKRLYDREKSLKQEIKRDPKDKLLKDELEEVQKSRDDVKKQMFDLKNKMR